MKKKTTYQISYSKPGDLEYSFYHTNNIKNARSFIEKNFPDVHSCWRNTIISKTHKTERIFRNIESPDENDYWNNLIKADIKKPFSYTDNINFEKKLEN